MRRSSLLRPRLAGNVPQAGQAMVEFALILPLMLLVVFIIADFGIGLSRWLVITNAAREGARVGIVGATVEDIKTRTVQTSSGLLDTTDVLVNYQDFDGNGSPGDSGDAVIVKVDYQYKLVTPLRGLLSLAFDSLTLSSCSDMRLEQKVDGAGALGGGGC